MDFAHPIQSVIPGVRGRILAVLAAATAELNLRAIAAIASVSEAQASRVLPELIAIGLVERREMPPSALFRLVRDHIAAGPVLALARSRDRMIQEMGDIAAGLPIPPVSMIIFGSFARGEAGIDSDIDTLMVRPADVDESDRSCLESIQEWIDRVGQVSGNLVEVLEVDEDEVSERLLGAGPVWQDIQRDGLTVHGRTLDTFERVGSG